MIKPGEYIQILMWFSKMENVNFLSRYSAHCSIEIIEACKRFDELRELHKKYKAECDHYDIYPHHNLDKMNMLIEDIHRITKEFRINVSFTTKGTVEYKNEIHANYYYETTKITDLIVMYQKRKPSNVSH